MKKIYLLSLLVGVLVFAGCSDDNDSNPTLQQPTTFVLNEPPYASYVYDLKNSTAIEFTCSQPDYSYPAATTYLVQIALKNSFSAEDEYTTLATKYANTKINVNAVEFAMALLDLWNNTNEDPMPDTPIAVYVRLKAALTNNGEGVIHSNIVELPKVQGYDVVAPVQLPEKMYLIGDFVAANGWANWIEMTPVHSAPGKFWTIQYFNANGAMKFNSNAAWDGGQVAYYDGLVPEASMSYAGISGVDDGNGGLNIGVANAGWYIIVVTAEVEGTALKYTLEFLEPNVYLTGDPSGGYDTFDEARLFTVPQDGEGEFVSPAFVANGELRMCIKLDKTDWWKTEFVILNGAIQYRGAGDDQERVNVVAGQKAYLNFNTNEGSIK